MPIIKSNKFIYNLLSVYSANAINGILSIIAVPLVVSALGNEQYGIFSVYTILSSYMVLVDLGVTKHFVRLMSPVKDEIILAEYLRKALGWYIILLVSLICMLPILIHIVSKFIFPVPDKYLPTVKWIVALTILEYSLSIPIMLSLAFTTAKQNFKKYSKFIAFAGVFRYGMMFIAALVFRHPFAVVLFLVLRRLGDIAAARLLLDTPPAYAWRPKIAFKELFKILGNAFPMSLAQTLQTTIISLGAILVNLFFGLAVLGHFRAAFDLASRIWFFSSGIGLVVFPKFSDILSNPAEREYLYKKVTMWLEKSWIGYLLISVLAVLVSPYMLPLLRLGDEQIILFFDLIIVGTCLNAHSSVSYEYLLADSRYWTVALLCFCALITLYASCILLLHVTGPYAVGWAWVICQAAFAMTLDELVAATGYNNNCSRWSAIIVKVTFFGLAIICLWSGLGIWPVRTVYTSMLMILASLFVFMKDFKSIKLSRK